MVYIETSKPVAYDSPDHVTPWGTADNNTKNPRFNHKLLDYIPKNEIKLLDIGCSGGTRQEHLRRWSFRNRGRRERLFKKIKAR